MTSQKFVGKNLTVTVSNIHRKKSLGKCHKKKKNQHQKKNKKPSSTWGHDDTTTMINFWSQHDTTTMINFWNQHNTTTMINFWSQHEVLLNVKHPNYLDKDCQINALNHIAEDLKEHGMDFSAEEISSKMHSLRVYFSAQKNKLILSKCSRAGTEDVYKVNWPFYEPLMFLNGNLASRSAKSNMTQNHLTSENEARSIPRNLQNRWNPRKILITFLHRQNS